MQQFVVTKKLNRHFVCTYTERYNQRTFQVAVQVIEMSQNMAHEYGEHVEKSKCLNFRLCNFFACQRDTPTNTYESSANA